MRLHPDRLNQNSFAPNLGRLGDRGVSRGNHRDCSSSVNRNRNRDDHKTGNSLQRSNLRREYSATSGYLAGSRNVADFGVSLLKNKVFISQPILLDVVIVDVAPIISWDNFI